MPPIQTPASDKLAQQRLAANTPMECPRCTGIFFYWADCAQFSNVGYGSAEFKMLTATPQRVLVCLCGRVMKPSTAPTAASGTTSSTFYQSILAADKYQAKADVNGIKQSLAQDFVGTAEFNEAMQTANDNMGAFHEQLTTLESRLTAGTLTEETEIPAVDEVTHDGKPVKPAKPAKTAK